MKFHPFVLCLICFSLWGVLARSQGSLEDYERARSLSRRARNKVYLTDVQPHWLSDGKHFWYRNRLPKNRIETVLVNAAEGQRAPAFDHVKMAAALSKASGRALRATSLSVDIRAVDEKKNVLRFKADAKDWECDLSTYELRASKQPLPALLQRTERPASRSRGALRRSTRSRDGKWELLVRKYNLVLRDRVSKKEHPLTSDGTADHDYSAQAYWSPDTGKVVAMRTKRGKGREIHLIESSPRNQLQPKLHKMRYVKPGDDIDLVKPHLFDLKTKKPLPISDELFPNPWRINELRWSRDGRRFTFLYNQRGHEVLRIVAVDVATGKSTALIDEKSETFIDYAYKKDARYLDDSNEIIWMSERDGWNHLYLFDAETGKLKNQITKGPWVVRGVDAVDTKQRQIRFRASGIYPHQDPYYVHHCRINFDGGDLVKLTAGDGTHSIEFSPDRRWILDKYSRVDLPPVTELRRAKDGKPVCKLEEADAAELIAAGWRPPERFVADARDGKTKIYGIIHRPTKFDAKKKYPVIESIYAGPHGSHVPKGFRSYYSQQSLAELGFIVVQIDGMGTSNRSKAFHDVCWKNLGDSGFPDRIRWIKAAAKRYPFMDLTRVGIYGTSAGGQSALRGLLAHGEFYKAGVAVCGCHDNRMDKIWWNELWMGWPVGPHYREQSNVTQAHKLTGKLLLVVGEMDRNVDPASTMQVVNALIKADKDFDLLVIPGGGHGIGGSYGTRRLRDFFVRHLLKVEPRWSVDKR